MTGGPDRGARPAPAASPPTSPGPPRVSLTTLGCKVNYAEMAELAGELAAAGCDVVADAEVADIHVLNSCTVTLQADSTTRQRLARLRRHDPGSHIVLTGCSVDGNPDRYRPERQGEVPPDGVDAVFSNAGKGRIASHVLDLLGQRRPRPAAAAPAGLRARAFLKVQDGCDHRCTYCSVWRARGASTSRPVAEVVERACALARAGHEEIVLCGVDLGSYGRDLRCGARRPPTLDSLVGALLDEVPARLRLSSINANDVTPALIALNSHERLCPHWHMPLQSGSDAVLRAMRRGYRTAQYRRVAAALREADPLTELTTDVMVGFPGERDEDHRATLAVIEEMCFLRCHVFRYSSRPDTPAAGLSGAVAPPVARRRSAEARRVAEVCAGERLRLASGRVHDVVWDRVEDAEAHGISAGYHEVVAPPASSTRAGRLQPVLATAVIDGARLRGRILAA